MNARSILDNTLYAFLSQGISFLTSIVISLVVPKVLGVTEFGYWQLFIFYSGYVGFFHFGLNDGVYLLEGGRSRGEIDKPLVKSQLILGLLYQVPIAAAVLLFAAFGPQGPARSYVLGATALYLLTYNTWLYIGYVFQAMNETRLYSMSIVVNRLSFLFPLLALVLLGVGDFRVYVAFFLVAQLAALVYCAAHFMDFLGSGTPPMGDSARAALHSIRVGSRLMLSNIASMLILGVMRFAIDHRWGIETFGKLSLSLSLVNFFLQFVSQAAMVLFPALRQSSEDEIASFYRTARDTLSMVFPAMYLLYFPMVWLLGMWLPAYAESLRFFAFLIPICVFDSKMNIACTTLFKVRREEDLLLRINVVTMLASAVMVAIGVHLLGSVEVAIASATIAIIGRSVVSERLVSRSLDVPPDDVALWEVALTVGFVVLALHAPTLLAVCCYVMLYALFLVAHRKVVAGVLRSVRRVSKV